MTDLFALRRAFIGQFDTAAPEAPCFDPQAMSMWETLLEEEWAEFQQALADYKSRDAGDHAGHIHAMAELTAEGVDVLNVLVGLLLSQGLPVEAMTQAIHDANMRKCVDGKVLRRPDGKALKPPGWQPVNKDDIIRSAFPRRTTSDTVTTDAGG
jgi:predicted HAD superfamily Cof-like phosphohydrolase